MEGWTPQPKGPEELCCLALSTAVPLPADTGWDWSLFIREYLLSLSTGPWGIDSRENQRSLPLRNFYFIVWGYSKVNI